MVGTTEQLWLIMRSNPWREKNLAPYKDYYEGFLFILAIVLVMNPPFVYRYPKSMKGI